MILDDFGVPYTRKKKHIDLENPMGKPKGKGPFRDVPVAMLTIKLSWMRVLDVTVSKIQSDKIGGLWPIPTK